MKLLYFSHLRKLSRAAVERDNRKYFSLIREKTGRKAEAGKLLSRFATRER